MRGKALVGDLPFQWKTDFDFDWWKLGKKSGQALPKKRNLMVVIPGRDDNELSSCADHYDTAYMEDIYYKDQGDPVPVWPPQERMTTTLQPLP